MKLEEIVLEHGEQTMAAVEEVSKYIETLNLPREKNNELVSKLIELLTAAEREQFIDGLRVGIGTNELPKKKYVIGKEKKVKQSDCIRHFRQS